MDAVDTLLTYMIWLANSQHLYIYMNNYTRLNTQPVKYQLACYGHTIPRGRFPLGPKVPGKEWIDPNDFILC